MYKQSIGERVGLLSGPEILKQHEKVVEMDQNLVGMYPEISKQDVLLWHLMCGSTPNRKLIKLYDYPDDEISKFIKQEMLPSKSESTE